MKKGDGFTLQMKQVLRIGASMQDTVLQGKVVHFDEKEACLYLCLETGKLTEVSLDAIYECRVVSGEEQLLCTGRIRERYCSESGKICKMEIKNGFYKINLK